MAIPQSSNTLNKTGHMSSGGSITRGTALQPHGLGGIPVSISLTLWQISTPHRLRDMLGASVLEAILLEPLNEFAHMIRNK